MSITDPNDPLYDPAQDPEFMDRLDNPQIGLNPDMNPPTRLPSAEPQLNPPIGTNSGPAAPNPDVRYNPDGTVMTEANIAEAGDPADHGPVGMPAASPDDAPFSTNVVPSGWSRFPTDEEVAYLNKKYPT